MMVRTRIARSQWLLLACALVAGCSAPQPPVASNQTADASKNPAAESCPSAAEPRRLADSAFTPGSIVPVGFRSRQQPAETPPVPEISLGTPVDSLNESDRAGAAGVPSPAQAPPGVAAEATRAPVFHTAQQPSRPVSDPPERLPRVHDNRRSPEMDAVGRRADALVKIGFRLAERGAVYSARRNFFEALGLIARSLDVARETQDHSRALAAGRIALSEARQFGAGSLAAEVDLARLVAVHRTPVLKHEALDQLSPVVAQQRYYAYAQEQLTLAAGGERSAAMALYGLGKSAPQAQRVGAAGQLSAMGEQVTCFQSALLIDEQNYLAANELGVILAENGHLDTARLLFERSVAISEQAATWNNLAVALARLGDSAAASRAARRADELRGTRLANVTGDNVRWVDPATFAKNGSPSDSGFPQAMDSKPAETQPTPAPPQKKRMALLFPWKSEVRR
jgi:Flp pilus assembly protein TadD